MSDVKGFEDHDGLDTQRLFASLPLTSRLSLTISIPAAAAQMKVSSEACGHRDAPRPPCMGGLEWQHAVRDERRQPPLAIVKRRRRERKMLSPAPPQTPHTSGTALTSSIQPRGERGAPSNPLCGKCSPRGRARRVQWTPVQHMGWTQFQHRSRDSSARRRSRHVEEHVVGLESTGV